MNRYLRALTRFCVALVLFTVGCPHRSPLWSPDGKHLLVLAGPKGEEVDKAASQLWLVNVETKSAHQLSAPAMEHRFLSATWTDARSFAVITGLWQDGAVEGGTERVWLSSIDEPAWKPLEVPTPDEARAPKEPVVTLSADGGSLLVYPSDAEKVVVVSASTAKVLRELEPADLVGPGPNGGFLVYRPAASGDDTEVVAFGRDLQPLWSVPFARLREQMAAAIGKKPFEIVFNEAAGSHRPYSVEAIKDSDWVGLTVVFSDVGWKQGFSGFYARLRASDGQVIDGGHAMGLPGRVGSHNGIGWFVRAPADEKKDRPLLGGIRLKDRQLVHRVQLDVLRDQVHGYMLAPEGRRLALLLNDEPSRLLIYDLGDIEKHPPVEIALK